MTIQAEVAKLNQSQRDALRSIVGQGAIESISVQSLGANKRVRVTMYGVSSVVTVGPKGKLLQRAVA
jgi:hypothetical protein